jgi:hypothetical protein
LRFFAEDEDAVAVPVDVDEACANVETDADTDDIDSVDDAAAVPNDAVVADPVNVTAGSDEDGA